MAGPNQVQWADAAGRVEYCLIRDGNGKVWNSSGAGALVIYDSSQYPAYVVQGTEQGASGSAYYTATFPAAIVSAGSYNVEARRQAGGSPVETDPRVAMGSYDWNGASQVALSDLATSGQIGQIAPLRIARGTMIRNFQFKLVSAADHVTPLVSGVVSGQINRDAQGFGPLQSGAFVEQGKGWYSLQALTSGDLLADTVGLLFTANQVSGGAADQRDFSFVLQRVSGSP